MLSLEPFQARTFRGEELHRCVWVTGGGARYLLVPQFATGEGERELVRYALGSGGTMTGSASLSPAADIRLDLRFDHTLRQIERRLTVTDLAPTRAHVASLRAARQPRLQQQAPQTRTFKVLSRIPDNANDDLEFETVTGVLRFVGQNILVYVDQLAPSGANGLSDSVLTALGGWFDRDLYPLTVDAFAEPSDIDNNDHIIVLMTPVVNGLTPSSNCSVLIAGFFFGLDLILQPRDPDSNEAEVFYSFVADPQGTFGCARTVRSLEDNLPQVFVHEFQHMINFNQHRLVRSVPDEITWLDEGLSHMAEEIAARFYEKYPPLPGRLFSDTAQQFIIDNLANSYDFLESTGTTSLTLFENTGTIAERGAAWLFLRWLADQRDSLIFRQLVQTPRRGIDNIENVAGESFETLFGDFAIALFTDSIVNHPRSSVPPRNRFKSRNLRQLYAWLNQVAPTQFPRVFPLVNQALLFEQTRESSMYPGTMEHWNAFSSQNDTAVGFRFARVTDEVFPGVLSAQLGVFRLP